MYALAIADGDNYGLHLYASTGRLRKVLANCFKSTAAVRANWHAFSVSTKHPLLYGRHVVATDDRDRIMHQVSWAILDGVKYRITEKFYYAKEGDGFTQQVSVRRTAKDGYVWASQRFVDPTDKNASISRVIKANAKMPDKPNARFKSRGGASGGFTSKDRELPNSDAWSA
jgi:hypothetical protein